MKAVCLDTFLFIAFATTSQSLKCYYCDSEETQFCSNVTKAALQTETCNRSRLYGVDNSELKYLPETVEVACFSTWAKGKTRDAYIRGCQIAPTADMNFCELVQNEGEIKGCNICTTDGCNEEV